MIEMCEEMKKLRDKLDKLGIVWHDETTSTPENVIEEMVRKGCKRQYCEVTIYRTHFIINDVKYSVINGFGTYGGYEPFSDQNNGLLEMMAENDGDPVGWLTADDVINKIFLRR